MVFFCAHEKVKTPKTNAKNKEQFGHAMRSTVKAMSLSSETHHIAKETR